MDKIELELCKQINEEEIFYRYRCGAYIIWFTQFQDNGKKIRSQNCVGCIFQIHVKADSNDYLSLWINERLGEDKGYPDTFEIEEIPYRVELASASEFLNKLNYALEHLQIIKDFLFNSEHYELFKKRSDLK